jgi:hypothetical protein
VHETSPDLERPREQPLGKYVAWLDNEEVLSAETCDALMDGLENLAIDESKVVIGWVLRPDVIRLGFGVYAIVPPDLDLTTWGQTEPRRSQTGDEEK